MLAPWKKSYDQPRPRQHIKKQRHYFAIKGLSNQSYGFSSSHVRMWELYHKEGWVLKNWSFQTVLLGKTVEILLDSKEIKPVNPKEINPEYSLEGLKLKLQHFGHLMLRADSLEKILMLGKTERRKWQRMRWLDGLAISMDMNLGKLRGMARNREAWRAAVHGVAESDMTWRLNNNTLDRLFWLLLIWDSVFST